ncbi:MAG: hypothetical protein J6P73_08005 [Bacteroidales bacterium]|nr:hypothetical protein [Bacteroidales bacterium]
MNKKFKDILTVILMLLSGATMATNPPHVTVNGCVYGGGNEATVKGNSTVLIDQANASVNLDVYGGGALAHVNANTILPVAPSTDTTYSHYSDTKTMVTLEQGSVGRDIYGGGLGDATKEAMVFGPVQVVVNGGSIGGSVFGCNNVNGTPLDTVTVTINGSDATTGGENGTPKVYAIKGVYGGGNQAHYEPASIVKGYPKVTINNCATSIDTVFGGGKSAAVPQTNVIINGGDIGCAFAGGNGSSGTAAHVGYKTSVDNPTTSDYYDASYIIHGIGDANIQVKGGTIGQVFGGSNMKGVILDSVNIDFNKVGSCAMHIGEVYGGGNQAPSKPATTFHVGCTGGPGEAIDYLYGGANAANVDGNIELNITEGRINNVFGGNNETGTVSGTITVNINKDNNSACANNWYVGNVFGGGNLAAYSGNPEVNILNGTVSGNVYGGGNGDLDDNNQMAGSTGAPTVTIGDPNNLANNAIQAIVLGDVYGGGNAAKVTGNTAPTVQVLNKCNTEVGNVYGGGNAADVPATNVTIAGGTVHHDVFGGGHGDNTQGSEKAANVTGNSVVNVTGAKIDRVFAGSNLNGSIGGTVTLNINKSASASCDMMIGEVYGGGNQAESKAGAINIGCVGAWTTSHDSHNDSTNRIGYELEGIGTVYGGANAADVTSGNIALNINSGIVENVYGGNNANGSISGTIQVNINKEAETNACSWYVGNVFGGGNQAAYSQTPAVNIQAGTVSGSVYGGGNQAGVGGGNVTMTGGSVLGGSTVGGGIYGGCNTSGVVSGDILVTISDGIIGSQNKLNDSIVTNVFGGGYGSNTSTTGNVTVTVGSTSTTTPVIYGDVYGGSAMGSVNDAAADKTTVNIIGGVLKSKTDIIPITATDLSYVAYTGGNVYGGGLGDRASLGSDHSDVYAMVNGEVIVNIGTYTVDALDNDTTFLGYASIEGNVYGGNNTYGSPQDNVTVNIYGTNHTSGPSGNSAEEGSGYAIANVFGGGNEANYEPENGLVNTTKKARVNVKGCDNTIHRVFGGGNAAATPSVRTEIQGGRFYQVFGGGNGERGVAYGADINGDLNLFIHGGEVGQFYGASNQNGAISGAINTVVDNNGPCGSMVIDEFFCGGNYADINGDLETDILCSDGMEVHNLYGGCNQANISGHVVLNVYGGIYTNVYAGSKGDLASLGSGHTNKAANIGGYVTLNLYGGTIENAFGGSNINGNIGGAITVNVLDAEGECPLNITNIYGGSNLTSYTPGNANITSPIVNVGHIKKGIKGNVYGGSRGEQGTTTIVKSNPLVNIGYDAASMDGYIPSTYLGTYSSLLSAPRAIVSGSVFGGGDAAKVEGNTVIFLRNKAKVFGNVYGGGNLGEVTGDTKVIINGANQ